MSARLSCALAATLLAACATSSTPGGGRSYSSLSLSGLAKSDLDMVAEMHAEEVRALIRKLGVKLYKRNPRELAKSGVANAEAAVERILDPRDVRFPALGGRREGDAVLLAFRDDYQGDRVLAFVAGLSSMLRAAYNGKEEFYMTDDLSPQKLYNSARNLEIAAWKLNHARDPAGQPYLLANETEGPVKNLSFERELGKLIAHQDMLARILAQKTGRGIVRVIQNVATAAFLPL